MLIGGGLHTFFFHRFARASAATDPNFVLDEGSGKD